MGAKAKLKAYLELHGKNFFNGLKTAGGQLKKLGKWGAVAFGVIAAAVTATAGAIWKFTSDTAGLGNMLGKMSKRTGIATEDLSRLRYEMAMTGMSMEDLEPMIKKMSRIYEMARDGSGEAVKLLNKLGLTYQDLEGKSPIRQFELMTSRLRAITDASRRAGIAQLVFEENGTRLLPYLGIASKELFRMRREAHELGVVMSGDSVKSSERFTDAVKKLKFAFEGIRNQAALVFMDVFSDGLDNVTTSIKKFIADGSFAQWMINSGREITSLVHKVRMLNAELSGGGHEVSTTKSGSWTDAGLNSLRAVASSGTQVLGGVTYGLDWLWAKSRKLGNQAFGDGKDGKYWDDYLEKSKIYYVDAPSKATDDFLAKAKQGFDAAWNFDKYRIQAGKDLEKPDIKDEDGNERDMYSNPTMNALRDMLKDQLKIEKQSEAVEELLDGLQKKKDKYYTEDARKRRYRDAMVSYNQSINSGPVIRYNDGIIPEDTKTDKKESNEEQKKTNQILQQQLEHMQNNEGFLK